MSSSASGVVPLHTGQPEPGSERDRVLQVQQEQTRSRVDQPRVPEGLDWNSHGLHPRWLDIESSD